MTEPWREMLSEEQRRTFNAACGDLAKQIVWHGNRMDKDDWRHFISGTILGWRMMPAYNRGEGAAGFIMLGGSSLKLSKAQCVDAITMAFHIGDAPHEQNISSPPVKWCDAVMFARGFNPKDLAA